MVGGRRERNGLKIANVGILQRNVDAVLYSRFYLAAEEIGRRSLLQDIVSMTRVSQECM